ncbi:RDD family protein [Allomuricauda sp. F6463D]|uniref:RDD family protein n=1 Tax=Allomuricauda sp. F6463D TaxID=2926409 RepID=UPI001FF4DDB3|nr:RDD family protein [Muricauda sp. F6463D]MCK0161696.1 RDD family protein [Muricauda sp. F6463D]
MKKRIRICNFLLDSIVFFIAVVLLSMILKNHVERESLKYFMIPLYYAYYFVFEYTSGQTIGKMITKTKVVNVNEPNRVGVLNIFWRTISRLIPIDILSYLFSNRGIHDILSQTELKKI